MAIGETFSSSTVFLKICLVLTPLQTLLYLIGFSSYHWVTRIISINPYEATGIILGTLRTTQGLWGGCIQDECSTADIEDASEILHVTRLFATLALIGFVVTTVGVFVCLFVTHLSQRRILHILTLMVATVTGVSVLIAVLIYGSQYNNPETIRITVSVDLDWSFGLCVAALVLDIITTILLVLNVVKKPRQ
ncbi:uncharacterized protein LOC128193231 [Crassostrea angulata]|uniref:uncharacterized protein LOC128193231 n=1 Tax=Magallana angulata TaxID=2784310 RepID=UPI0022B0E3D3|nr:uncharacterized protein LOC128193231 [Crassostrea angulata]